MTADTLQWFQSHQTLVEVAGWMAETYQFDTPVDVVYFFEKPWKYEDEWREYIIQRDALADHDR